MASGRTPSLEGHQAPSVPRNSYFNNTLWHLHVYHLSVKANSNRDVIYNFTLSHTRNCRGVFIFLRSIWLRLDFGVAPWQIYSVWHDSVNLKAAARCYLAVGVTSNLDSNASKICPSEHSLHQTLIYPNATVGSMRACLVDYNQVSSKTLLGFSDNAIAPSQVCIFALLHLYKLCRCRPTADTRLITQPSQVSYRNRIPTVKIIAGWFTTIRGSD